MAKKLNLLQNVLFVITIFLLIYIRFIDTTLSIGIIFMYILFITLIILHMLDVKNKNKILNDNYYLIIFILVCLLTNIILVRSMFDFNIVTVNFIKHFDSTYKMMFLKSNLYLINIPLILLICYNLTYKVKLPKISIKISIKK